MKNKFYDDNNKYTILYLSDDDEEIINIKPKQILYHLCNNKNNKKIKKNKKKYINNNIEIKNKFLEIEKKINKYYRGKI
jgi:hypothetical protein